MQCALDHTTISNPVKVGSVTYSVLAAPTRKSGLSVRTRNQNSHVLIIVRRHSGSRRRNFGRNDLNFWIGKFVQEVSNTKGERYPGRSLYQIVSGLKRYYTLSARTAIMLICLTNLTCGK